MTGPISAPPRPPSRVTRPRGGEARGLVVRLHRLVRGGGDEPALDDHPWRSDGALDESGREVRSALLGGAVFTSLAAGLAAAVLPRAPAEALFVVGLVLGAFLLGGLWFLWIGVAGLLRRSRHGLAELRFGRFPFLLGQPLEATLVRDGPAPPLPGLHARLTCVSEVWDWSHDRDEGPARGARRSLRRVERWSETRPIRGAVGSRIQLRFDLPPPGPTVIGTRLSAEQPVYWELELWAEVEGPDFAAVFLVPVYQEPEPRTPAR
jgi:hypothetical protein